MKHQRNVVWREGMFVAPQHFQQNERYLTQYVQKYVNLAFNGRCYGISALEFESSYLKLGKLSVTRCSGVFEDGTLFDCAQELVIDIPEQCSNTLLYLALPLAIEGENEFGERSALKRYAITEHHLFDSSDAQQSGIKAVLAEPNIRLVLEGEETHGLVLLPVARILERAEDGEVLLDKSFIPACLHYGASSLLQERLKELLIAVQVRANEVMARIGLGERTKSETSLMREFLWLQTLNRWLPQLAMLNSEPSTHIDVFYQKLLEFNAELASFTPSIAAAHYLPLNKAQLNDAFGPLFNQLRDKLSMVQSDNVLEFEWDATLFNKRRLLRVAIPNLAQLDGKRWVLAVKSPIGAANVSAQFASVCTLSGISLIAELVRNSQSGITVTPLPVAPPELKAHVDLAYFEVDTAHDYWQLLKANREPIALHIDARIADVQITLYALG
ncbi:type VI secretion system baseplate subunit TssK [Vibrio sp. SM6]|uniref:Type VI secretion system baseplate subunit TssK n=1 Tax=Vibrio agarilyticus TaxID=2726741 RepID=A0A7X8TN18_9VIBR|nr:type VI secretion system baseplate subunit TssK [Vibrio agarilyticus]NLS11772.1 type VI secretion system baseplate subunit TssK [Vibrio agarilyticus]